MTTGNDRPDPATRLNPGRDPERLAPLVYDKLRALARVYLRREGRYHTLQPTALVNEAYVRLAESGIVDYDGKTHFYALAARQMRRVLIDHARSASARKRFPAANRVVLTDGILAVPDRTLDLLQLDEALDRLSHRSQRQGRVAEMRLFAGLPIAETAATLGVSEKTVKRDWSMAKAWLSRELSGSHGQGGPQ